MSKAILNLKGLYNKIKKSNYNFKFSQDLYLDKLNNVPLWMEEQIENDLSDFKNTKISKSDLEETILNLKKAFPDKRWAILRVKIKNNKLKIKNYLPIKYHPRYIRFVNFLTRCLKLVKFPDVEFLYTLHDIFDESWLKYLKSPVFGISKKIHYKKFALFPHIEWMEKNDVLIGDLIEKSKKVKWEEKKDIAYWIGSASGERTIDKNVRYKIVKISKKYPNLIDASFTSVSECKKNDQEKFLNNFKLKKGISPKEQLKYKYLCAIDGNAFPGSFFWQLFSNSLIIKNKSTYLEWYYSGLRKNEHYMEYESENDLIEILEKKLLEKKNIQTIVQNANDFALSNLKNESIVVYIVKLLESYSKIFHFN